MQVRLETSDSAGKAGVGTGYPVIAEAADGLSVLGQITYNKNKLAVLTPLVDGVLHRVLVDVGETVEAGQLLAEINSPEFAREKNAYIKVLADRQLRQGIYVREKDLHAREISARQELEEAKAAFDASTTDVALARQRLVDLGLGEAEVAEVASSQTTGSALPLRSPFAGTVIERNAVTGVPVSRGAPLFRIADLSTMWMELSVPESQMARIHLGSEVAVAFEPLPGQSFGGVLTWISSSVDGVTRMLKARAEVPNPDGMLRNAMFGQAHLKPETSLTTLTVPRDAVQRVDGRPVVFAKLEADLYESRLVALGAERGGQIEVLEGLSPADEIVTRESYVLKSELLKARLGAGCVHE